MVCNSFAKLSFKKRSFIQLPIFKQILNLEDAAAQKETVVGDLHLQDRFRSICVVVNACAKVLLDEVDLMDCRAGMMKTPTTPGVAVVRDRVANFLECFRLGADDGHALSLNLRRQSEQHLAMYLHAMGRFQAVNEGVARRIADAYWASTVRTQEAYFHATHGFCTVALALARLGLRDERYHSTTPQTNTNAAMLFSERQHLVNYAFAACLAHFNREEAQVLAPARGQESSAESSQNVEARRGCAKMLHGVVGELMEPLVCNIMGQSDRHVRRDNYHKVDHRPKVDHGSKQVDRKESHPIKSGGLFSTDRDTAGKRAPTHRENDKHKSAELFSRPPRGDKEQEKLAPARAPTWKGHQEKQQQQQKEKQLRGQKQEGATTKREFLARELEKVKRLEKEEDERKKRLKEEERKRALAAEKEKMEKQVQREKEKERKRGQERTERKLREAAEAVEKAKAEAAERKAKKTAEEKKEADRRSRREIEKEEREREEKEKKLAKVRAQAKAMRQAGIEKKEKEEAQRAKSRARKATSQVANPPAKTTGLTGSTINALVPRAASDDGQTRA
eukprot:g8353.t1